MSVARLVSTCFLTGEVGFAGIKLPTQMRAGWFFETDHWAEGGAPSLSGSAICGRKMHGGPGGRQRRQVVAPVTFASSTQSVQTRTQRGPNC